MKLYTEKQLERAMDLYKRNVSKNRIVESLTPIELPTDEEIENYARQSGLVHPFISRGAKWMRDKIQGGNK
jgi:hypothetical protein